MNKIKVFIGSITGALISAPAFAALDLTGVTFATADYIQVALLVLGALATIWGMKRVLGLASR